MPRVLREVPDRARRREGHPVRRSAAVLPRDLPSHSAAWFCARSSTGRACARYWEEMVALWDMVPVPENVLSIPQVAFRPGRTIAFQHPSATARQIHEAIRSLYF